MQPTPSPALAFLSFQLGSEAYGVDIRTVRELRRCSAVAGLVARQAA